MNITVTLVRKGDKVKIVAASETKSIGDFVIDTAYDTADNILKQVMDINAEFGSFCPVLLNTNGAIISDRNTNLGE